MNAVSIGKINIKSENRIGNIIKNSNCRGCRGRKKRLKRIK